MSGDDTPRRREVAHRLFAAEFDDADFSYAESDEDRAPNYVVTPSGARVNRLFVVGVLTAVEQAGEDILRARVVDPTGAFVVYAGQYQPDAQTFFERADPPMFVAVTGKARTFQPDDSDAVFTSVRPETVNEVDAATRDRWTVQAAEQTVHRVGVMAGALRSAERGDALRAALDADGVEESLAAGVPLAIDHYGTTGEYLTALRDLSLDAARVVADEVEEVESFSASPGQGGEGDLASLAAADLDLAAGSEPDEEPPAPSMSDATAGDSAVGTPGASAGRSDTGGSDRVEAVEPDSGAGTDDPAAVESAGESSTADAVGESTGESTAETADEALGESTTTVTEDVGDFDPGEFELDAEEREEIESEFGTEFQSGTDVDEPGEADIETPDPEDLDAEAAGAPAGAADADRAPDSEGAPAGSAASTPDADDATGDAVAETPETASGAGADEVAGTAGEATSGADEPEPTGDVDLPDAVVEAMSDLDDGDGADREAVVSSVVETYGVDPEAVEDAIQEALMNGRCYEPDEGTLKPI